VKKRRFRSFFLAFLFSFAFAFCLFSFYPGKIFAQQDAPSLKSLKEEAIRINEKYIRLKQEVEEKYVKEMNEKKDRLDKIYDEGVISFDEWQKRTRELEREYEQKIKEERKRLDEERKKELAVVCEKLQKFYQQKVENIFPLLSEMPYFPKWEWKKEEDYGYKPFVKERPEKLLEVSEWRFWSWVMGGVACSAEWEGKCEELVKEVTAEVEFEDEFQEFINFLSEKAKVKFNPFRGRVKIKRGGNFIAEVQFYTPYVDPRLPEEKREDPGEQIKKAKEQEIKGFNVEKTIADLQKGYESLFGNKGEVKTKKISPDQIVVEGKVSSPGYEGLGLIGSASRADVVSLGLVEDPEGLGRVLLYADIATGIDIEEEDVEGGFEKRVNWRWLKDPETGKFRLWLFMDDKKVAKIEPEEYKRFERFFTLEKQQDDDTIIALESTLYGSFSPAEALDNLQELGIGFEVHFSEDINQYILPPDELLSELLNSVNLYFSRIKVGKVPVEKKEKKEERPLLPEEKSLLPEKDYIKLMDIFPEGGEELEPEKDYSFNVKVEYGLSSREKGLICLEVLADDKYLTKPVGVEVEKGTGEESIKVEVKVPRRIDGKYVNEVIVYVSLLPEGKKETEVFKKVSFPVNQELKFSVEAEKEEAVANGKDKVKIKLEACDLSGNPLEERKFLVYISSRLKDFNFITGYKNLAPADAPDYRRQKIILKTDKEGKAEFLYISPSVDKAKNPLIIKGNDPFKVKPFDEIKIKDEVTGKERKIKIYLISPYPKIKKFTIAQPVYSRSWSPITIEIEDPDSNQFLYRFRVSLPGRFDYEGKITPEGKGFIAIKTNKKKISVGYEPPLIGFDISQVPTIGGKMWEKAEEAAWDLVLLVGSKGIGKVLEETEKTGKFMTPLIKSDRDVLKKIASSEKFKKFLDFLKKDPKEAEKIIKNLSESPSVRKEFLENIKDAYEGLKESWQTGWKVGEAMGKMDVSKELGYSADVTTLILGVACLTGKIGDWPSFGATTCIRFLKGFEELYREYQDIANAYETTIPCFMMVKVEDSEGNTVMDVRPFYIVHYEK